MARVRRDGLARELVQRTTAKDNKALSLTEEIQALDALIKQSTLFLLMNDLLYLYRAVKPKHLGTLQLMFNEVDDVLC